MNRRKLLKHNWKIAYRTWKGNGHNHNTRQAMKSAARQYRNLLIAVS